jgi:hypothetical protein
MLNHPIFREELVRDRREALLAAAARPPRPSAAARPEPARRTPALRFGAFALRRARTVTPSAA